VCLTDRGIISSPARTIVVTVVIPDRLPATRLGPAETEMVTVVTGNQDSNALINAGLNRPQNTNTAVPGSAGFPRANIDRTVTSVVECAAQPRDNYATGCVKGNAGMPRFLVAGVGDIAVYLGGCSPASTDIVCVVDAPVG